MMKALVALLIATAAPGIASACSPPVCTSGLVAPAASTSVPAGVTAFPIRTTQSSSSSTEDAHLVLAGATVPASLIADSTDPSVLLLVPTTPPGEGSYTIERTETCNGGGPTPGSTVTDTPFSIVAAVPQPTSLGQLGVSTSVEDVTATTSSGSCTVDFQAAVARLTLVPSAAAAAWAPVTRYTLVVDGTPWASSEYGELPSTAYDVRNVQTVFARCDQGPGGDDDGLPQGTHHAVLQSHIAGATTDPAPLTADFTLYCYGSGGDDIFFVDDMSVAQKSKSGSGSSSGCSVAPGEKGTPLVVFLVLISVIGCSLGLRRRRHFSPAALKDSDTR